jgi:hypothetical protein
VSEGDCESSIMSRSCGPLVAVVPQKISQKLCDSYQGKRVRLESEAVAMHTIPARGGGDISGALYGRREIDYSGN